MLPWCTWQSNWCCSNLVKLVILPHDDAQWMDYCPQRPAHLSIQYNTNKEMISVHFIAPRIYEPHRMGICQIVGGIFYTCWWCNRSETLRITKGIFFWELWAVLQNTLYFSFVQSGEGTDDIIPLFQFRCWGGGCNYPSCHRVRGRVQTGQFTSLSQC